MINGNKGVSPILAAVLLIAFTVAIASIMATWATTFTRERLSRTGEETECIGALDISELSFSGGVISLKVRNVADGLNLTGLKAIVEYNDPTKNKQYTMQDYNVADPLSPASTAFFIVDTGDPVKPKKIEALASNCARAPVSLVFR